MPAPEYEGVPRMRLVVTLVVLLAWFLAAGGHDFVNADHDHDEGGAVYAGLMRAADPVSAPSTGDLDAAGVVPAPLAPFLAPCVRLVLDRSAVPRRAPPPHPSSAPRAPPAGC